MPDQETRSILEIRPAKDSETAPDTFVQVLSSLQSSLASSFFKKLTHKQETVTLEISCLDQTIFFIITAPTHLEPLIKSQVAALYSSAVITPMQDYLVAWLSHGQPQFRQLKLAGPIYLPLKTLKDETNPLTSVLGVLAKLSHNRSAIIQLCLSAAPKGWDKSLRRLIQPPPPKEGESASPPHLQKALIEQKLSHAGFSLDLRLAAITPDKTISATLLSQLGAALGAYSLPDGNSLVGKPLKDSSQDKLKAAMASRSAQYTPNGQVLNYLEIASLFHLPNKDLTGIKNIAWGKSLKGEPPANLPVAEGLTEQQKKKTNFFARTEFKNRVTTFGIKRGEDRRRHVYILGKSGTGKTTLIANMAIADIKNGEGVVVVDPHGDLSEILLNFIPRNRINDIAYLDPANKDSSFRLNPLTVNNPEHRELVASGIISIFTKIWANVWSARMEYILRNTILTLVEKPGATFLDIPKLLTNKKFRDKYLESIDDPVLLTFWRQEYDKYSEKFQSEAIAPILNKVGQFITSPTIRNIIGHPTSTIDLEEMINSGKIIILNLAQGRIGEDNSSLLGAMVITQLQIAAMNRVNLPEENRRDVFLYVDEFQNFATNSFIKILSEARKFRLNLILANQYTAQLPEEIQKAIFGNAGTVISFVVGADDANRLAQELGNLYSQDDLVGLEKYQIITKLSVDGTISTPFPAYSLPLPYSQNKNRDKVLNVSKQRYYKPISKD